MRTCCSGSGRLSISLNRCRSSEYFRDAFAFSLLSPYRTGNDPLTNGALDKLFTDYKNNNGQLPDSYYKEYGQFLFNTGISQAKSNGSDELMSMSRGVTKVINFFDNEKGFGGMEGK